MKYERILSEIYRKPWAILPEKLAVIGEIVRLRAAGEKFTKEEIRSRLESLEARAKPGDNQQFGSVALIPVYGVISHRINLMSEISGGTSVEKLTKQFRLALADSAVKAIVFDVDSPGGGVEGIPELASEILQSRGQKKIVAVANSLAASAAYWIASAADELVVIPSGQVGSIGVFTMHEDYSKAIESEGVKISVISAGKYKTEANPYEPLSDEARASLQEKVDSFYGMFLKAVAKGRGVSQAAVRDGFGQGRLVLAADAVKQRMADRSETLDQTLARLGANGAPKKMAAESPAPKLLVSMDPEDPDNPDTVDECECMCEACMDGDCSACTNAECMDDYCSGAGCPNQAAARAAKKAAEIKAAHDRRRRELDFHL